MIKLKEIITEAYDYGPSNATPAQYKERFCEEHSLINTAQNVYRGISNYSIDTYKKYDPIRFSPFYSCCSNGLLR